MAAKKAKTIAKKKGATKKGAKKRSVKVRKLHASGDIAAYARPPRDTAGLFEAFGGPPRVRKKAKKAGTKLRRSAGTSGRGGGT